MFSDENINRSNTSIIVVVWLTVTSSLRIRELFYPYVKDEARID